MIAVSSKRSKCLTCTNSIGDRLRHVVVDRQGPACQPHEAPQLAKAVGTGQGGTHDTRLDSVTVFLFRDKYKYKHKHKQKNKIQMFYSATRWNICQTRGPSGGNVQSQRKKLVILYDYEGFLGQFFSRLKYKSAGRFRGKCEFVLPRQGPRLCKWVGEPD